MDIAAAAVLGLIMGSFASAVAYRVPRRESIAAGRSRCPHCGEQIAARDNIPVLSYLWLRGRCRHCKKRISISYPLVESATGGLFALAAAKFGVTLEGFAYAAFFWVLVVLTVIDLEHRILPNRIVYPSFLTGWVLLAAAAVLDGRPERLVGAAAGAAIFGGFLLAVHVLVPKGMGGGDVKLAFVLGTFLGYQSAPAIVLTGMFLSFFAGGFGGVLLMVATGGNRKTQVPFGPYLALGSVAAVAFGRQIVDFYVGTFGG